ncbi:hypothetical protein S-CBS2_gp001 [Synechococcus phage S-CBS2]|uniref:hypothetical protein n=1 Tax=Synechococcus phage S-CBS2 TaxID=753084 RepID=UPI00020783DA|nr:hypothetical protein S-CBS2_gp001 [Synechococcus phage S-CBS2]ADF42357.1 hypothetical protein S-CBS2_gp001 [Synechococcus phage S-CBS2]
MKDRTALIISLAFIAIILIVLSFASVIKEGEQTKETLQKVIVANDSIQTLLDNALSELSVIQSQLDRAVERSSNSSSVIRSNINSQRQSYEVQIQSIRYHEPSIDNLVISLNGSIYTYYPFD